MAERKAGPVKPPVIEGVAREATPKPEPAAAPIAKAEPAKPEMKAEPAAKPEAPKAEAKPEPKLEAKAPPRQEPPQPPHTSIHKGGTPIPPSMQQAATLRRERASDPNWPLLGGVALTGALLGTLLTYLLANVFAVPSPVAPIADPGPELIAQEERTEALEQRLMSLEASTSKTQQSLDATIVQLDSGLIELRGAIAAVKAAIPAPVTVDLSGIETELKTLKSRVDALSAGVSGDDANAIAQSLATIDTNIGALATRIDGVDGRLTAIDGTAASLRSDLEAARKLLNDHIASALPSEVGPALKLPLILSGLETAFDTGKPFAMELDALGTVMPDLPVPGALRAAAADGLIRPELLQKRFEDMLPTILAARSGSTGDWAQDALAWLKSLLALRPAEETDGDTPDAIASRLEAAMTRGEYQNAAALLATLPAQMRDAAAPLAADIAVHAEAETLLAALRSRALTGMELSQ
jgi:hypothetical protein